VVAVLPGLAGVLEDAGQGDPFALERIEAALAMHIGRNPAARVAVSAALHDLVRREGYTAVIAVHDATLARLGSIDLPVPTLSALDDGWRIVQDKARLGEVCERIGVPYPAVASVPDRAALEPALERVGLPAFVTAETASPVAGLSVDETATALFRYADGMLAELTASFLLPAADTSIEIYGTRATALLSGVDLASRDITGSGFLRVSVEGNGGKRWEVIDVPPRFKLGQFHHQNAIGFVRSLRTGEAPPAGLGAGRAALLMIEAAYRAARTGVRQPVEPDPDHGTS